MFANRTQRAMGSVINLEPDETRFSVYLRLSDGFWKMKKIRNGCRVAGDHCRAVSAFEAERDCVLDKQFNDSFYVSTPELQTSWYCYLFLRLITF